MNLSAPFIARPIATTLLTVGVVLAGLVAFYLLPVAPLPQVDFPTIVVRASLPGASPEVMASTIATPLERSLGRIAGITEMTSSSTLGSTSVTLQFDLNRDINGAARDVQAAINAARTLLPTGLPRNPTYRKANPADAPIMLLALTSETMTQGELYDVASTILAQKISQIIGVGEVGVGGSSLPAVRIELNPDALNKYGIGLEQVRAAISAANQNRPKGAVEDGGKRWQIEANDQAKRAADYQNLVIAYKNGAAVHLTNVGEAVDSVQDIRNAGVFNGKPAVLIVITKQPGANIIEVVERVKTLLPSLKNSIPAAVDLTVVMERTATIRGSLHDVELTLLISVALVILIVFLFLRNSRATLIPSVAIPVSLISTFGAMYLCGYSLDNLSLMALVIATGFVVDDAIVVLENISRHIEAGMEPKKAALVGAKEVGFTVLSMSISLIAVFIPILMMGGIIGRLFREFAVTLSFAILISLVVSLTVTPMMCARLLKREGRKHSRFYLASERMFESLIRRYDKSLRWALDHKLLMLILLLCTIAFNIFLFTVVPKGFFPQQDTGRIQGSILGDQSASFQLMKHKLDDFVKIIREDPAVENVIGFTGGGQRNSGNMFILLKPKSQRGGLTSDDVIARLRKKLASEPGAKLFLQTSQDIRMGGRMGKGQYQFTVKADELKDLKKWTPKILEAMKQLPELIDVATDQQDKGIQTTITYDRDMISRLGLTLGLADSTLNDAFGQRQISVIYNPLNQYRVVMEVAPQYWQSSDALRTTYVTSPKGAVIPLSAFSAYDTTSTSLEVNHQGQFASSTITFNLPIGVALGDASDAISAMLKRLEVPDSVHGSFQGTAKVFKESFNNQGLLIIAALLTVYIVLGILYESYIHPITILSTLPSAGVGALLALWIFRTDFTIIAMIGLILLIGIVKKNAIMMIDFAIDIERQEGTNARDAIYQACLLRFRPIMMTTAAAMLGALPLVFGIGEGAELRQPLGIAIVGGLIVSQMLTLYTTPVVYLYFDSLRVWWEKKRGRSPVMAKVADENELKL